MADDFSYLSEVFPDWYDQMFQHYAEHLIPTEDEGYIELELDEQTKFIDYLGLTKEQFRQAFLDPYLELASKNKLSPGVLSKLADFQSKAIGHRREVLLNGETPLVFKVEPSSTNYLKALSWTVINVISLKLPGFELWQGDYDIPNTLPERQCHYCGAMDSDKRDKAFNQKLIYCHAVGCKNSSNPNPEEHKKCCYGQWGNIKKSFRQRLKRNADYKPEVIKIFIEFCNERLEENLKIQNEIRYKPSN